MQLNKAVEIQVVTREVVYYLSFADMVSLAQTDRSLNRSLSDYIQTSKYLFSVIKSSCLPVPRKLDQVSCEVQGLEKITALLSATLITNQKYSNAFKIKLLQPYLFHFTKEIQDITKNKWTVFYNKHKPPGLLIYRMAELYLVKCKQSRLKLTDILISLFYITVWSQQEDVNLSNLFFALYIGLVATQINEKLINKESQCYQRASDFIENCICSIMTILNKNFIIKFPSFKAVNKSKCQNLLNFLCVNIFKNCLFRNVNSENYLVELSTCKEIFAKFHILTNKFEATALIGLKAEFYEIILRQQQPVIKSLIETLTPGGFLSATDDVLDFLFSESGRLLVKNIAVVPDIALRFVSKLNQIKPGVLLYFKNRPEYLNDVFRIDHLMTIFNAKSFQILNGNSSESNYYFFAKNSSSDSSNNLRFLLERVFNSYDALASVDKKHGFEILKYFDKGRALDILRYNQNMQELLLLYRSQLFGKLARRNTICLAKQLMKNKPPIQEFIRICLTDPAIQMLLKCKEPDLILQLGDVNYLRRDLEFLNNLIYLTSKNCFFVSKLIKEYQDGLIELENKNETLAAFKKFSPFVFNIIEHHNISICTVIANIDLYIFISRNRFIERIITALGLGFVEDLYQATHLSALLILRRCFAGKKLTTHKYYSLLDYLMGLYSNGDINADLLTKFVSNGFFESIIYGLSRNALAGLNITELQKLFNYNKNNVINFCALPKKLRKEIIIYVERDPERKIYRLHTLLNRRELILLSHSINKNFITQTFSLDEWRRLRYITVSGQSLQQKMSTTSDDLQKLMVLAKRYLQGTHPITQRHSPLFASEQA